MQTATMTKEQIREIEGMFKEDRYLWRSFRGGYLNLVPGVFSGYVVKTHKEAVLLLEKMESLGFIERDLAAKPNSKGQINKWKLTQSGLELCRDFLRRPSWPS